MDEKVWASSCREHNHSGKDQSHEKGDVIPSNILFARVAGREEALLATHQIKAYALHHAGYARRHGCQEWLVTGALHHMVVFGHVGIAGISPAASVSIGKNPNV